MMIRHLKRVALIGRTVQVHITRWRELQERNFSMLGRNWKLRMNWKR
jgi:hypothetical protein